MTRPLSHDDSATHRDVANLHRILRRVIGDPKRKDKERKEVEKLLKRAITILLNGNRTAFEKDLI